jgi:hypothetical protein
MNLSSLRTSILLLFSSVLLAGCATQFSFPDSASVDASAASSFGGIQGSNYGGHAPLVGAHVFLMQAGTNGYGGKSTSLLAANETGNYDYFGNNFPTFQDLTGTSSNNPTYGMYYVQTDAYGVFNLTGTGYTCTPGLPVYLYAQGGNPQTVPTFVNVTGATISGTGPYTITLTSPNLLYQGESITFTGYGGSLGNYLNGAILTVLGDANLTTTTFDVSVGSLTHNGVTLTTGTQASIGTVTAAESVSPTSTNPAVVNLAVLGNCPSSGTANFSYLPFVYMNEVSTAAAAYALGGFFPSTGTVNAGALAANLSIPASNAQALLGLQNAAITADQLYDIAGSNIGTGGDGETHVSRSTTPGVAVYAKTTSGSPTVSVGTSVGLQTGITITGTGIPANTTITAINTGVTPNTLTLSANATASGTSVQLRAGAGNGTVPQTLLSTIGNILANCVDAANTYNPFTGSGTAATQCTSLFGYAKSAGTSGTTPIDTASAAINIAHNPWANVTSLVNLPTGNQPFQPTLAAANDFAVGIKYTPAHVSNPEGIAVDANGYIWYPNANGLAANGYVTTLTPFGAVLYNQAYVANQVPHYVTIDGNGYAWYGDANNSKLVSVTGAGVLRNTYEYNGNTLISQPYAIASDGLYNTGYIYVEDLNNNGIDYFDGNGNTQGVVPQETTCLGGTLHADHSAFDSGTYGQNLWTSSEAGGFICKPIRTASTTYTSTSYAKYTLSPSASPNAIAIDYFGIAYVPANSTDEVVKVAAGAASGTTPTVLTGATLSSPFGVAVDGQGHIFVSNRTGNNISQFSSTGAVSAVNYTGSGTQAGTYFSDPLNIAIDPSGAIWVTNYTGNRIVELLGVGVPTYTPLSLASYNNALGARP